MFPVHPTHSGGHDRWDAHALSCDSCCGARTQVCLKLEFLLHNVLLI